LKRRKKSRASPNWFSFDLPSATTHVRNVLEPFYDAGHRRCLELAIECGKHQSDRQRYGKLLQFGLQPFHAASRKPVERRDDSF
jgi:hypothetical protein